MSVKEIRFYEPDEPYGFLSNFYLAPIEVDGERWLTTEHFYHAQKFTDRQLQRQMQAVKTPCEAFKLSRELEQFVRDDWMEVRYDIMHFAVMEKFLQNQNLCQLLVETAPATLIENSPCDSYWGIGERKDGANKLGIILMSVRAQFSVIYRHD
ncbi:NADAR family protein [Grimontia sp. NTOU-MAR1]|uniref:NADAR family protein n=1 Tax=Grimontia sp. NTOU-MAR1 TaxID=3111011 RepID=UPI002DB8ECDA|nr:NADAR family protein [Grimontia sp. NTOU-MAR1]WRW00445.1 NADAR family protein [Grimontia sp. NTOU-MAR1]